LERTIGPANERRRHFAEEAVENEVDEIRHPNNEKDVPSEKLLRHNRRADWLRRSPDANDGKTQLNNKSVRK
jgi:hypothetical protein